MKKLILIVFVLAILTSCGPHRMKCGPKRNCDASTKTESVKENS